MTQEQKEKKEEEYTCPEGKEVGYCKFCQEKIRAEHKERERISKKIHGLL